MKLLMVFGMFFIFISPLWAGDNFWEMYAAKGIVKKETLENDPLSLIDIHTLKFGGKSFSYYAYQGYLISDVKSVQILVYRLKDPEAIHSINAAQNATDIGHGFGLVGAAGGLTWIVMELSSVHSQDPGLTNGFLVGSVVLDLSGWILAEQSRGDMDDAIEHYDHAFKEKKGLSLNLLPLNGTLALGLTQRF